MQSSQLMFTLLSCVFFMGLVGWISYQKTKGSVDDKDGYFLAGRGLTGTFIAGSMLLTNLSAEQLIGLNGSAYGFNMSAMAWEVTAGFATIIMALVFLPRYLSGAFTTLPSFLKERFDDGVRRLTVILFMVGYGLVTIPSILYSGSVAVLRLFDVPTLLNLPYAQSLVITVLVVGSVGAIYAVFGGLKAVVVSDTINGIGLLIIGLLVPTLGLIALGEGSFAEGLSKIANTNTHKLNAVGAASDPVPFGTIFTGMILADTAHLGCGKFSRRTKRCFIVRLLQTISAVYDDGAWCYRISPVQHWRRPVTVNRFSLPSAGERRSARVPVRFLSSGTLGSCIQFL